jgi:predicted ATPase
MGRGRSLLLRLELSSAASTRNKAVKHEHEKTEETALLEDDTVMNKLNRLRVRGFRRLYDVDLDLRPMMVIIGANGVGKTSILDAVSLLSASASGNLNAGLSALGGIGSLLTRGVAKSIAFDISMEVPGHNPLDYSLELQPKGNGYQIEREELSQDRGKLDPFKHITAAGTRVWYHDGKHLVHPEWDFEIEESALSQVPRMFREPEEFRKVLATATRYHVLDVGSRAPVKLPQPMKPAVLPGADGEDLVPLLYSLREGDRSRFDAIIDSLHAAFPTFEALNFPPVAAGTLAMTWNDKSFDKPLYMNELSEGTLRFLWLVSLLQSPSLSTVTMIDEPEVSLHPELLSLLADLMREAADRTQLIVATHSDRLIRFLEPKEVVVMDSAEDGLTTATWADQLDLEKWLVDYTLDEVWRMGRMGGRA